MKNYNFFRNISSSNQPQCGTYDAVALDGGAHLLRAGSHVERYLGLETVLERLLGDGRAARHVLVTGVRTTADQSCVARQHKLVHLQTERCLNISSSVSDFWSTSGPLLFTYKSIFNLRVSLRL